MGKESEKEYVHVFIYVYEYMKYIYEIYMKKNIYLHVYSVIYI